jgi:hypothetical protein
MSFDNALGGAGGGGAACVTRTRDPIITKAGLSMSENERFQPF